MLSDKIEQAGSLEDIVADVTLLNLAKTILMFWRKTFLAAFVCAAVAVAASFLIPPKFQSEALMIPSQGSVGGVGTSNSSMDAIASLVGIGGDGASDGLSRAHKILNTRKFLIDFIRRNNLEVSLLAAKRYEADGTPVIDPEIYDSSTNKWLEVDDINLVSGQPSNFSIYGKIQEIVGSSVDRKEGTLLVTLEHESPVLARVWLGMLLDFLRMEMARRDASSAERNLEFLQNEIAGITNVEIRETTVRLIEMELKRLMLAQNEGMSGIEIIDPPLQPELKSYPGRTMFAIVGGAVGYMLSLLLLIRIHGLRRDS